MNDQSCVCVYVWTIPCMTVATYVCGCNCTLHDCLFVPVCFCVYLCVTATVPRMTVCLYLCVFIPVCACMCVRVTVTAPVCVCVCACGCICTLYDCNCTVQDQSYLNVSMPCLTVYLNAPCSLILCTYSGMCCSRRPM
jgi:hypothetical protein